MKRETWVLAFVFLVVPSVCLTFHQLSRDLDSTIDVSSLTSAFQLSDTIIYPPCTVEEIPHYFAYRSAGSIQVDGHLDEPDWQMAPRSSRFRDLVSGAETLYDTRAALIWDDQFLYVGYWIEEPNVRAILTERDAPIYQDNDVELFIAGKDSYYEFEINALGTIYEVFFIWEEAYTRAGFDSIADFQYPQSNSKIFHGVGYKPHPRGPRIGFWDWDFPGLQHAVRIDGTINDDRDVDRGWQVELAIPWKGMYMLNIGDGRSLPPKVNDTWRMDFSRFNQYKGSSKDSGGWAWSPHGVWDSHVPECFTFIHFSSESVRTIRN